MECQGRDLVEKKDHLCDKLKAHRLPPFLCGATLNPLYWPPDRAHIDLKNTDYHGETVTGNYAKVLKCHKYQEMQNDNALMMRGFR